MIDWQVVPIDYGQGLDTKTDPKRIRAGKFLQLQNGIFTNPNRISKRNGYSALSNTVAGIGSLVAPQMAKAYNNELVAADQNTLLSYSPSSSAWVERGVYTSIELIKSSVDQEHPASGYIDVAVMGNYALYGWSTQTNTNNSSNKTQVYASIVDLSTGAAIYGPTSLQLAANNSFIQPVKCICLGGTKLALIYFKNDASAIVINTFSIASGTVTPSGESTISISTPQNAFDSVTASFGGVVAYPDSNGIVILKLNSSGAVTATQTLPTTTYTSPIHVNVDASQIWVYFCNAIFTGPTLTTSKIVYAVMNYSLVITVPTTDVVTFSGTLFVPSNLIALSNGIGSQTLYYGYFALTGHNATPVNFYTDLTRAVSVSNTGTIGSDDLFANGVMPLSRAFSITQNSQTLNYAFFSYRGGTASLPIAQIQPTLFLVELTYGLLSLAQAVARFAIGLENTQMLLSTERNNGTISYIPNVMSLNATEVLFPFSENVQEFHSDSFALSEIGNDLGTLSGNFSATFNFNSPNAYRAVNAGEVSVLNGAIPQIYDGNICSEFGFNMSPEIVGVYVSGASSGNIPNGNYSYLAIFQWTDAQGNLHQSTPSNAYSFTNSSGNSKITIYVTGNFLSQKRGVSVAIYRTQNDGTIYYLVTDPVFVISVDDQISISFEDNLPDSGGGSIVGNPQAYSYPGSAVVENTTPPPSMVMASHTNRLWFVDSENPNTIWYTKSFEPLVGLSPSGFLIEQIDQKLGNISALAEMDEKLIIFKTSGIVAQSGDGANDTGSGSTLSFPQFIPSDVGCDNLKSVVLTPQGLLFHSPNGIYQLSRALQVSYLGMEVEAYNSQQITSADLITGKSQIRFLCYSGLTLIYDYIFGQWGTFSNYTGISATIWNGKYTFASGANIMQETPGVYSDNGTAITFLAQTGWLTISSVQNFQRVRRFISLGDFVNGASGLHGVSVAAAYDFSSTFQQAIPYYFSSASNPPVFQYRERLPIQKCDAVSLLITELVTGDSAEYMDLTNMSFEAGLKKGVNKLGALYSNG